MRFSQSETMGSSGVLRNIFIWLWERVVAYLSLRHGALRLRLRLAAVRVFKFQLILSVAWQ